MQSFLSVLRASLELQIGIFGVILLRTEQGYSVDAGDRDYLSRSPKTDPCRWYGDSGHSTVSADASGIACLSLLSTQFLGKHSLDTMFRASYGQLVGVMGITWASAVSKIHPS
jgi:hypothetical protein